MITVLGLQFSRCNCSWLLCWSLLLSWCFRADGQTTGFQSRFFYAIESLTDGQVIVRGSTTSAGISASSLILAPNTNYREWLYQSDSSLIGFKDFVTPSAGSSFTVPPVPLGQTVTPDSDQDGLGDDAEFIIGTNPANPHSIVPNILDGVAVQEGLTSLSAFQTGIIGITATPGKTVDVAAFNDIVVTADSDQGISVFNVFNTMNPLIIARAQTPFPVQAVALSEKLIAAACGTNGLLVLDVSNPPNLPILHQVNVGGGAMSVAVGGGIAYVGMTNSKVVAVDMATGIILNSVTISGSIHDVGIGGDTLYALTANTLYAISLTNDTMQVSGSVAAAGNVPIPRRRLFVGTGLAYAVYDRGYTVFSLANPNAPTLVRDNITSQFGWKQIVANGSGSGIAAVGAVLADTGAHDVSLYSLNPSGTNGLFQTTFPTPGIATAISLYNGLAYVADGLSGLAVINYLVFDTSNQPPAITLTPSFGLTSPTNASVVEGKLVTVSANVSDDVQVRNVEFYIDGVKVSTDGNFPFEYRFTTPARSVAPSFKLQARASDTGGNFTWSSLITVNLLTNTSPPTIRNTLPPSNSIVDSTDSIFVFFNTPVDPSHLNTSTFQVFAAGPDGRFGTSDDYLVTNGVVSIRDSIRAGVFTVTNGLPNGLYMVSLSSNITSVAGYMLTNGYTGTFWTLAGGASGDADSDGLTNSFEVALGFNPINSDTDGDGWDDGVEYVDGTSYVTNAALRPRMTFASRPPATVVLPGPDEAGISGIATTSAKPPVQVVLVGPDETGVTGGAFGFARPAVEVKLPGSDELGSVGTAVSISRPAVSVALIGADETGATGNPTSFARPPLTVQFPGTDEAGILGKTVFLARPPVTVTNQ